MLIVLPTTVEAPELERVPAPAPVVTWMWFALITAVFAADRALAVDLATGWNLIPPALFAGVSYVLASWSLYADPALFAPWQLWSHAVVHAGWIMPLVNLALLVALGRPLERLLGGPLYGGATLLLVAVSGLVFLLLGYGGCHLGAGGLVAGLCGLAWALTPLGVVRFALLYWAVVAVGYVPLFTVGLRLLILAYLMLDLWSVPVAQAMTTATVDVAALLAGFLFGLVVHWRQERGARA
jgi:membrane associated rhomboid family serine protease